MAERIRIAFIGAGVIARRQMESLKKLTGVDVVALSDIDPRNLEKSSKEYSVGRVYPDWKELLASDGIDAVSVCTPNFLHCEQSVAALASGRHVLVEKPMAMNPAEAARMVEAAAESGKVLQIGFQERFSPAARMLKRQVDAGFFGRILYVKVKGLRRRGLPNWGVYLRKEYQGGGALIDFGIHMLEMAHYLMGSPEPTRASGACYRYMGGTPSSTVSRWPNWDAATCDVEDLAVGLVRFADGASLSIETSFAAQIEKDVSSVEIMGTKGGASTEPLALFTDVDDYMMTMNPAYLLQETGFDMKMRHFVECARDGLPCEATASQGLSIQKMIDGIYRSSESGREVELG